MMRLSFKYGTVWNPVALHSLSKKKQQQEGDSEDKYTKTVPLFSAKSMFYEIECV